MEDKQTQVIGLKNLLTEETLLKLFGISKETLDYLRQEKNLPFIKITNNSRLYLEPTLMKWLQEHEKTLNEAS